MLKILCVYLLTINSVVTYSFLRREKHSIGVSTKQKIQVLSGPDRVQTAFPDPMNCKRFYICSDGVYHLQCPVGLVYNVDLGKCDIQTHNIDGYQQKKIINNDQGLTIFPDMYDDSKFFLCDGQTDHYECSGSLYYNADYAKCDRLGNLTCRLYWKPPKLYD